MAEPIVPSPMKPIGSAPLSTAAWYGPPCAPRLPFPTMRDLRTGGRDPGADAAVRGARYAEEGACVPWATMAAIERATRDAADRRAAAQLARRGRIATLMSRVRHRIGRLISRA
jgi:hypothetical protein